MVRRSMPGEASAVTAARSNLLEDDTPVASKARARRDGCIPSEQETLRRRKRSDFDLRFAWRKFNRRCASAAGQTHSQERQHRRPPTDGQQLDPGSVLNNRYEIVRRIGGGGMGAVYLAKDRNLGDAPRAVKEMVEAHLDPAQHEKAIGDFKRESLLLTSLEHPSIPTIYDYFYDETLGRFYLVMKFISGGDLASRLRSAPGGRVDEKTVADWGMQDGGRVEYLHSRPKPIIYRDSKPANLMIDGNSGRVMLIDFGIARWVKQEEKGVTAVARWVMRRRNFLAGESSRGRMSTVWARRCFTW